MKKWTTNDNVVVVMGIICTIIVGLAVCIAAGICERVTHEAMDEAAAAKAFCDSAGGQYGGGKCYKDGKEITE